MNHIYRLVWNRTYACWQAVAETARGQGKSGRQATVSEKSVLSKPHFHLNPIVFAVFSALTGSFNPVFAEPLGGQVTAGSATILQSGNNTTINQTTPKAAIDWSSYSVKPNEAVTYHQPDVSSITLNRVTGTEGSVIAGAIKANGQVYILNPNGVLFSPTSQVNVGGIVASTMQLSNADFLANNFNFNGVGKGSVENQGNINVAEGGVLALLAPVVKNSGTLNAPQGTVLLAASDQVSLKLQDSSQFAFTVSKGTVDALIDNGGLIKADGGHIIVTAKGRDALSTAVINHSGVIQAQTVSNKNGVVELLGDMQIGQVNVTGKLDASAPKGGDGGFIDTSAAKVKIAESAEITTKAKEGKTGTWLIDPTDYTIAANGGDITGTLLSGNLENNNVTVKSIEGLNTGNGDITVNDGISWVADNTLTLQANRNINIKAHINGTGDASGVVLNPTGGDYFLKSGGKITLSGANATFAINGNQYTLIHNIDQLQAMNSRLSGKYALGNDIDASATSGWNTGAGFKPIGSPENSATNFTGLLDGLGHTINQLTINRSGAAYIGLFGVVGTGALIKNIGVTNSNITGGGATGVLVGGLYASTVNDSYATGNVVGNGPDWYVGGLVGINSGTINTSYALVNVSAANVSVGGLVGLNDDGVVNNSYAAGNVNGDSVVGGLVGGNGVTGAVGGGKINNSYSTGRVTGSSSVGGLVGANDGTVTNSYWDSQTSRQSTSEGGTGKTTAEMQKLATFANWDFINTWRISEGSSYPLLRTLTEATLILNAQAANVGKVYDKVAWTGGGVIDYSGFTAGDTSSALQGTLEWGGTSQGAVDVGTYSLIPSGLWSPKYDIVFNPGTLDIVPRIVDVEASKTYNGNPNFTSGFTASNNVLAGDTVNVTGTAGVSSGNAGSYTAFTSNNLVTDNPNYTANPVDTANYSYGSFGNVKATIIPRVVDVSVGKTYDNSADFTDGFTAKNVVVGDTVNITGTASVSSGDAGSYTAFTSNNLVTDNPNYTANPVNTVDYSYTSLGDVKATIAPRVVDVSVNKTYDSSSTFTTGFTVNPNSLLNGDTVNISGSANVSSSNAGTYTAFTSNSLVTDNSNYTANPVDTVDYSYSAFGSVDAVIAAAPVPVLPPVVTPTPTPVVTPAPEPTTPISVTPTPVVNPTPEPAPVITPIATPEPAPIATPEPAPVITPITTPELSPIATPEPISVPTPVTTPTPVVTTPVVAPVVTPKPVVTTPTPVVTAPVVAPVVTPKPVVTTPTPVVTTPVVAPVVTPKPVVTTPTPVVTGPVVAPGVTPKTEVATPAPVVTAPVVAPVVTPKTEVVTPAPVVTAPVVTTPTAAAVSTPVTTVSTIPTPSVDNAATQKQTIIQQQLLQQELAGIRVQTGNNNATPFGTVKNITGNQPILIFHSDNTRTVVASGSVITINEGDIVQSGHAQGVITFIDGSQLRLDTNTTVEMQQENDMTQTIAEHILLSGHLWGRILTSTGISLGGGGLVVGVRG